MIEATANYRMDRAYFESYYQTWWRYRAGWRRYLIPCCVAALAAGIALLVRTSSFRFT